MNSIVLLTRLQLMQAIGGFRASLEKRAGIGGRLSTILTVLLGIVIVGAAGWLGSMAHGMFGLMGQDRLFFDIVFLVTGSFTFVFSLPAVLGSFFGSSDINDLLPLPVSTTAVVLSKALGALATSYLWTGLFMAGPLAGWGIASGAGALYWLAYLMAIVFTPFLPTAYAGILSILIAKVFKRARRRDTITTIATVLSLALSIGFYLVYSRFKASGAVANELSRMAGTLSGALSAFPAYGFAIHALQTGDAPSILLFALISLAFFGLFVLVARVLYIRIVTSLTAGGAGAKAYGGEAETKSSTAFSAMVRAEFCKVTRTSQVLLNFVVYPVVITPVLMLVMMNTGTLSNIGSSVENPQQMQFITGIIVGIVSFLAAIDMSTNKLGATAISREGSNWIHMKYLPVSLLEQLRAKSVVAFSVNALTVLVILGVSGVYLVATAGMSPIPFLCAFVYLLGASWLAACVGVRSDARRPSVEWGNDGEVNIKAIRGTAGMLRGLVVGVIYTAGLAAIIFLPIDLTISYVVLMVVGAVAGILIGNAFLRSAAQSLSTFE